jgi:hypothetical protein
MKMAQEQTKPYLLFWDSDRNTCTKAMAALTSDNTYRWTWDNLKRVIGGAR